VGQAGADFRFAVDERLPLAVSDHRFVKIAVALFVDVEDSHRVLVGLLLSVEGNPEQHGYLLSGDLRGHVEKIVGEDAEGSLSFKATIAEQGLSGRVGLDHGGEGLAAAPHVDVLSTYTRDVLMVRANTAYVHPIVSLA